MRRFWLWLSGLFGMLSWFVYLWLFVRYSEIRPRHPDPATGHIYEVYNHGFIGYITRTEQLTLWVWLAIAIAGAIGFTAFVVEEFKSDAASREAFQELKRNRRFIVVFASVGVLVIGSGFALLAFLVMASRLDATSRSYVDRNAPIIVSSPSIETLMRQAAPELRQHDVQIAATFAKLSRLGQLLSYSGARGQSHVAFAMATGMTVTGSYASDAIFENGAATIDVRLVQRDGEWQIEDFNIESPLFRK